MAASCSYDGKAKPNRDYLVPIRMVPLKYVALAAK
jgi:hypothetical protein